MSSFLPPFADPVALRKGIVSPVKPAERMTVTECADRYVRLNTPGGYKGPFRSSAVPYMVEPMDTLASREKKGLIFVGGAQCAKTQCLIANFSAYNIKCVQADMSIVHMTQTDARDYTNTQIDRMIQASPALLEQLSPSPDDDNDHEKLFRAGNVVRIVWPVIGHLSGKPNRYMAFTDYDRHPPDIDKEGSGFDLGSKRTTTFLSGGMTVAESSPRGEIEDLSWTPKDDHDAPPTTGVVALYSRGDRRRWYWPCLHCGQWFQAKPGLSQIHWVDSDDLVEAAESARLCCPHCSTLIDLASDKYEMNSNGLWVPQGCTVDAKGRLEGVPRRSDIASYWLGGIAAAFLPLRDLVLKYLQAFEEYERTESQQALKVTVNVDQAMPYRPMRSDSERTPEELMERKESLGERVVPLGVRVLLAAIDVQKDAFIIQVEGIGIGKERWIVDRFKIRKSKRLDADGDPLPLRPASFLEDWDLLIEKVIKRRYPLCTDPDREMAIRWVSCDSGGKAGTTEKAYSFWRRLKTFGLTSRFSLVKGGSREDAPRIRKSFPDSDRKDRKAGARGEIPIHLLNTTIFKDALSNDLDIEESGPGYIHFPDWLADWFFKELCAEIRGVKKWVKVFTRNEAIDLSVYNRASWIVCKGETINWNKPPGWAAPWDSNTLVFTRSANDEPERPTGTDWGALGRNERT